jgi:hypothetical protein
MTFIPKLFAGANSIRLVEVETAARWNQEEHCESRKLHELWLGQVD